MKLYYAKGACSLCTRIILNEAGFSFQSSRVSMKTHQLEDGRDYKAINLKGCVPLLQLDSGETLTENAVIVQWIADQVPEKNLMPAIGTMARYRVLEWLNFIATELHKNFSPLFYPAFSEDAKTVSKKIIQKRLAWVNQQLEGKDYLVDNSYSVADAYLFVVCNWANLMQMDIRTNKNLVAFLARIAQRPAVQQSLQEEGL